MIKLQILLITTGFSYMSSTAQHPFKYDNTMYKAVHINEAFRIMDSAENYLLLDVRSAGEYADTSSHTALNIGRIKGAININIDDIPARIPELKKHISEPVFLYCSHSQRSRRVSKLLAENGFKKVFNINGGMSLLNEMDATAFPYKHKVLETNTPYANVSASEAAHLISITPDLMIIDIRTEAGFASSDSIQKNNIGHLKNAINIPQKSFSEKFATLGLDNSRPVLLYDLDGHNSMDVVNVLQKNGFSRIYNLYGGLSTFASSHTVNKRLRSELLINSPAYTLLDTKAAIDLINRNQNLVILDARSSEEFENKATSAYLNLGRLKGAIHIPSVSALEKSINGKKKSTQFLVYGSASELPVSVCKALIDRGFDNVSLLSQGFYRFVWSTRNVEDCQTGQTMLTNHEGLY